MFSQSVYYLNNPVNSLQVLKYLSFLLLNLVGHKKGEGGGTRHIIVTSLTSSISCVQNELCMNKRIFKQAIKTEIYFSHHSVCRY